MVKRVWNNVKTVAKSKSDGHFGHAIVSQEPPAYKKLMNKRYGFIFVAVFAVLGVTQIIISRASTVAVAFEPEGSAITTGATIGTDSTASGGKYVQFGTTPTTGTTAGKILHYSHNASGAYTTQQALGFNLMDINMSTSALNALPSGTKALVWTGEAKCAPLTMPQSFIDFVDANATNPKLYGFYMADEPESTSTDCVTAFRTRADYMHSKNPNLKAMILLTDYPGTYAAYRPAVSHLDIIAIDPYPCRWDISTSLNGGCDYTMINKEVNIAIAAGIPKENLAPTYQFFGDNIPIWRPPSATQMQQILDTWHAILPQPPIDMFYTWNASSGWSQTDTLSSRTDWQQIAKSWITKEDTGAF
jgi:hypothetical protein